MQSITAALDADGPRVSFARVRRFAMIPLRALTPRARYRSAWRRLNATGIGGCHWSTSPSGRRAGETATIHVSSV